MKRVMWWKLVIVAGIDQDSAAIKAPFGACERSMAARELMTASMREVMAFARPQGIHQQEQDLRNWHGILQGLSPQRKTSMLQDIEAGR